MTGFDIFIWLGIVVFIIFTIYCFNSEGKKEKAHIPDVEEKLLNKNIIPSNIKLYLAFTDREGCLVYTNDNKLYNIVHDMYSIEINQIDYNKILDVKIDIHYKEKNSMRIISIVPTFDKYHQIVIANMVITTEDEIFDMTMKSDGIKFDTRKIFLTNKKVEWRETINELNRLKLLIEKNIKDLRQEV